MEKALDGLSTLLWQPQADAQVYWLIDGARNPEILGFLRSAELEYSCLFSGALTPRLQAAAPYIVRLVPGARGTTDLLSKGWGKAWGIFAVVPAKVSLSEQRLHFKKFIRVMTEQGEILLFRFYDPKVLATYLPTCTDKEFQTFLGSAHRIVFEQDDGGAAMEFSLRGTAMHAQTRVL